MNPQKNADKSYTATYILASAVAKSANKEGVASYIANNEFKTPYGSVSFNKDHAVDTTPVKIEMIKNGELVDWK